MKTKSMLWVALLLVSTGWSQVAKEPNSTVSATESGVVPRLVRFAGVIKDDAGKAVTGVVGVTFALYKDQEGGGALWMETQNAQLDSNGRYSIMLGASKAEGVPSDLFATGEARWLGVQAEGRAEQPRVLLLSVPYALKAADAETVGGLPASAFLRALPGDGAASSTQSPSGAAGGSGPLAKAPIVHGAGTVGTLPLWSGASLLGTSAVSQSGSNIGIGTTSPASTLDVNGSAIVRGNQAVTGSISAASGSLAGGLAIGGTIQAADGNYPLMYNSLTCCTSGNRMVWAHSPVFPNWGIYYDDNVDKMHWRQAAGQEFLTADFPNKRVGIGTTSPRFPLDVLSPSIFMVAIAATGANAPTGTSENASAGIQAVGGNGSCCDSNGLSGSGGSGIVAYGGTATPAGGRFTGAGVGGTFTGGASTCTGNGCGGDGIDVFPGNGPSGVDGMAAYFGGDIDIAGIIYASTKDFKIDHPLDPANKYLFHASVESSEMMNIYTGNVTTDAEAEATVQLPEWFEALNADFRYQLTVIGQFAQAIVAREISGHQFVIRTSAPNVKVSWQVTGVRQDAYAKANPLIVEQGKSTLERGYYIHPRLFGASDEKQIEWARHPEMMKLLSKKQAQQPVALTKQ